MAGQKIYDQLMTAIIDIIGQPLTLLYDSQYKDLVEKTNNEKNKTKNNLEETKTSDNQEQLKHGKKKERGGKEYSPEYLNISESHEQSTYIGRNLEENTFIIQNRTLQGHSGEVKCVIQLSDERICSCSSDGTIKVNKI